MPRVERRSWLLAPPPRRRPAPGPAAPRAPWDDAGPRRRKLPASCRGSRARRRMSSEVRGPLGWRGSTAAGSDHRKRSGGGAWVTRPRPRPIAASIASIGPAGIQALRSARPPQRMTRLTSRRASAGWGAKSPRRQRERRRQCSRPVAGRGDRPRGSRRPPLVPAPARVRLQVAVEQRRSRPPRAPPAAASSAAFPVPHAKSMTWSAGDSAAISTTACATSSSSDAVPSYLPAPSRPPPDHDARTGEWTAGCRQPL